MASTSKKVASGTLIFFTRKVWIYLFSGAATLYIIRALGVYHYGILTLALSVVGILAPFLDFDIGSVISVDIASELGKNQLSRVKKLIKEYVRLEIIIGLIFSLSLIIFNGLISQKYGQEIGDLVKIISALLFLQALKNIFSTTFYGFSNFRYFTLIDAIESLVKFIFVIGLYYFGQFSVVKVAVIILVSSLTSVIITLPLFIKSLKPLKNIRYDSDNMLKEILFKHGKFHVINQPIKSSLESLRLWFIKLFVGVEGVALFQVANKLFGYISILFSSFEGVLLPVLAEEISKNISLAKEIVKRSVKYFTFIGILVMIFSFLFIGDLLRLFFYNKYDASLPIFYWLTLVLPAVGFSVIIRPMFFAFKGQKYLLKSYVISTLLFGYPLGIFLTYKFGVVGFAIPIGNYVAIILRYYYIRKIDKEFYIKFKDFFRFDKYDKILVNKVLRRLKLVKNNS